jgi:type I restriction enzyme S subunit
LEKQHRIVAKVDELMALCDRLEAAQTEREQRRDRLAAASLQRLNQPDAEPSVFREHIRFHLRHLSRLTTRPEQITQLRQTLLSLAVRGRIVSQEPSDEPSAELLKRIHAWQISALAERRIRLPRKPLLGIGKEEVPYGLPKRWVWARLGELIYIRSGDGLTLEQMIPGHVPVYGGNGVAGFHNVANIQSPTLVIGRVGYYCGSIHVTPPEAWVTDNAFITEFCSDAISQKFLVLLLKATNLKEKKNATAQPVISGTKIYPIVVGLPPLAEQYRIVAKVDELMAVCDQLETQLTTTQTESQRFLEAVLHQALEYAHKSSQ